MLWDRSPLATAPITRAASLVGCTRLATSEFTFVTESAQAPETGPTDARSVIFPCCPIARRRRSSSEDRKSTRLNSSYVAISYAVFCLKKKKKKRKKNKKTDK